jgi:hypothetical protein
MTDRSEAMMELIDECERSGRRRTEIAAFLAREYGLDCSAINRLMSEHVVRAGRLAGRAAAAAAVAAVTFVQRHTQEHAELVPLLAMA